MSPRDTATKAAPTSPLAYERGAALQEEKAAPELGGIVELMTNIAAKVDSLKRSLGMQQQGLPITPPRHETGLGQSVCRQALQQGGSLDMHRM
ncbi:hypothetical protein Plhal710r2_c002g0002151 [Plasmopara halstedii]